MTIKELIENLKIDEENGVYEILRQWHIKMSNLNNKEEKNEMFHNINGFFWGLLATEYINEKENNELFEELMKLYKK